MEKNVWNSYGEAELNELQEINEKYKICLDNGKTERECVKVAVEMAKEAGYRDVKDVLKEGKPLAAGDKVYAVCMEKMIALFRMGEEPLSAGMNILGAHIDSPRIDVKQNPLYENEGLAYLDTHYYGGIKKISVGCSAACSSWRGGQKRRYCRRDCHWRKGVRSGICNYRPAGTSGRRADGKESLQSH